MSLTRRTFIKRFAALCAVPAVAAVVPVAAVKSVWDFGPIGQALGRGIARREDQIIIDAFDRACSPPVVMMQDMNGETWMRQFDAEMAAEYRNFGKLRSVVRTNWKAPITLSSGPVSAESIIEVKRIG